MASLLASLFALCATVQIVYGLNCYTCNSNDNSLCKYGLTSFTYSTQECSGDLLIISPSCYKVEAKNKNGDYFVARGCLPPGTATACQAIAGAIGLGAGQVSTDADDLQDLKCITCSSDKCNSAIKLTGTTIFGLLLATIIFLF